MAGKTRVSIPFCSNFSKFSGQFIGCSLILGHDGGQGYWLMVGILLLRLALWAFGLMLGSLGVFFAIISFRVPSLGGEAVIFLGAALSINYFLRA
jgi:hypothetical protein